MAMASCTQGISNHLSWSISCPYSCVCVFLCVCYIEKGFQNCCKGAVALPVMLVLPQGCQLSELPRTCILSKILAWKGEREKQPRSWKKPSEESKPSGIKCPWSPKLAEFLALRWKQAWIAKIQSLSLLAMVSRLRLLSHWLLQCPGIKTLFEAQVVTWMLFCRHRIPEPIRQADFLSREYLRLHHPSPRLKILLFPSWVHVWILLAGKFKLFASRARPRNKSLRN